MSSILGPRPDDRPPRQEDWGTGVTISVAAHLALIGALWWGLHWHSSTTEVASEAELWSQIPDTAAPPPEQPPPPPPEPRPVPAPAPVETPKPPDIVVEQVKEKKPPKPTPAPPPPKPAPPPPPPKLDAKALQKLHDENLKRMMGQMDAPQEATGTGARNAGPSASYAGRVIARLKPKLNLADSIAGNPEVTVSIHCSPDGTVIARKILKHSASPAWDDAVLRAIDAAGKLPTDTDGRIPDPIELVWHLQD